MCQRCSSVQCRDIDEMEDDMDELRRNLASNGLVRPTDGRVLGGVMAGVGRRFGLDPWPARIILTLLLLVVPGSQLLLYPLLWVLMPSEGRYYAG